MTKEKLKELKFSDINPETSYMTQTFILTNSDNTPVGIDFDHPFSFNEIVFSICLKGSARIKIDLKEYQVEQNSIITILPNQIIESLDHSEDFFLELLAYSIDFLTDIPIQKYFDLPRKVATNPVLCMEEEDMQNLLRYHSFIIETFNKKKSFLFEQIMKGLLHSFLMEIVVLYVAYEDKDKTEKVSSRSEEIVTQFLDLLKDHYKLGRSASYYAEKMFITPKYLSSTLRKVTGRSINSWIEEAVVLGAKILLKSTNLTIWQISEELNFPNPSYFGRFFKKNTGITPKKYRES